MFRFLTVVTACAVLGARPAIALVINEFQPWNWSTLADEDDDYESWVELYNPAASAVNLAGCTLTDDPASPAKWAFPAVSILPGKFLLVWTSGKNRRLPGEPLHANFRLHPSGGVIRLCNPKGLTLDSATYGAQTRDASRGRAPGAGGSWVCFRQPTPGAVNVAEAAPGFVSSPVFSPAGGALRGPVTVRISLGIGGADIRYALGGAEPTATSTLYSTPLTFTTPTVIRARAFAPPLFPSEIVTRSYLVDVEASMALVSLVTDPANLWGPSGIYYVDLRGPEGERGCSVEYWEPGGAPGFAVTCGLRMHGGYSRVSPLTHKKSFRLYFRRTRGPAVLEYPLFASSPPSPPSPVDRFDKLVLRANYNDSWAVEIPNMRQTATYVRDQLMRDLRLETGDLAPHGSQCMLFLNGRRWGLYNLCERIENEFLQSHLEDDWDVLDLAGQVQDGDDERWDSFCDWFSTNDLSLGSNYETLQAMLDLENYTNYMASNIWARNNDWRDHNGYVACPRNLEGGKWIFLDWDSEYVLGGGDFAGDPTYNMMEYAVEPRIPLTRLLDRLLQNPEYRVYFARRMDVLLNTVYDEPHVLERLNEEAAAVRSAIPFETLWARNNWNDPKTEADWEGALQGARDFINVRTEYARRHVCERLPELAGWRDVRVLPPVGGVGDVAIQSIVPRSYPWTGTFFAGIPLTLRAIPQPGYRFTGWSDPALPGASSVTLTLQPDGGTTYTVFARFEPELTPPAIERLEFVARNSLAVRFDKPVSGNTAAQPLNYTLDYGAGHPVAARLQPAANLVLLTFAAPLSPRKVYHLSVVNVQPLVGIPIPAKSPVVGASLFTIPRVTISEILYDSVGPDVEWVELHNTTNEPVDVSGWYLTNDRVSPARSQGGWTLPDPARIPPHGYLVVAPETDPADWQFPNSVAVVSAIATHHGRLKNNGDHLSLFDRPSGGNLVDGSPSAEFPALAAPGRSIEKIDDEIAWTGNPLAWRECAVPLGWNSDLGSRATPGRANNSTRPVPAAARKWSLY